MGVFKWEEFGLSFTMRVEFHGWVAYFRYVYVRSEFSAHRNFECCEFIFFSR